MNIIEFQEFAKIAGIPTNTVSVYLKRGKIVAEKIIGEGKGRRVLIDIDNPLNKSFIVSRQTITAKKEILQSSSVDDQLATISDDSKQVAETKDDKEDKSGNSIVLLDIQLKKAELKLRNQKQKVNKIIIEKAEGRLIPTDIVGRSVAEVVQRYKASFVQMTDQLIRDALNSVQADNKLITETLSKLTDIANEVSHRANVEAKMAIENSISDSLSLNK